MFNLEDMDPVADARSLAATHPELLTANRNYWSEGNADEHPRDYFIVGW